MTTTAALSVSLSSINASMIAALAQGQHPAIERALVQRARAGELAGVVSKPARYSATSIQWFVDCERLFFWPTLAGLESPPSTAQKFGTKLHAYQERYLKTGDLPPRDSPEGVLANIGLPLLPNPKTPGLYVEEPFEVLFEGLPVAITGTKDFGVDPQDPSAVSFLLGDHKTAGSMNPKYKKTKAWLHGNVQSNLYAYTKWAELLAKGYDKLTIVDKQWIYYFKAEKQAERLRSVDSLDDVAANFENVIKPAILGMARMVREMPRVGDVATPSDKSVCDAYGGCPHRARCFGMGQLETNMGALAGRFTKDAINAKAAALPGAGVAINPPKPKPLTLKVIEEEVGPPLDDVETAETPQEETVAPAKRGRKPKGAEQLVKDTAAAVDKAFAPRVPTDSKRTPGGNPAHDFWLFCDCDPTFGFDAPVLLIEKIVGAAQADAAVSTGGAHYRGANSYGALEASFAAWLESNALVGAVKVDSRSIVARDVVGLLRAHASMVVEGRQG